MTRGMCASKRVDGSPSQGARRIKADDMRASDAERDQIVSELRAHAADGRLDMDELDQRVEAAYATKTRRDLVALTADLPRPPRPPLDVRAGFREHVESYAGVMLLLVVIWALTGAGYFWPVWPILGWGVGVVCHWWSIRVVRGATARRRAPA